MAFNFDKEMLALLRKDAFYGMITQQVERIIDKKCPSACIGFKNNKYHLYVNPDFMETLSPTDRTNVLIHEILHVIFGHTHRFIGNTTVPHDIVNEAMDIVVNQHVHFEGAIKESIMTPEKFNFPKNLTTDEYIRLLLDENNQPKKSPKNAPGGGQGKPNKDRGDANSHEYAKGQSDPTASQIAEIVSKNMVENALKACGKAPAGLEQFIDCLLEKGKIPWKQVLRRFVDFSRKFELQSNRFKINRRIQNILSCGKKRIDLSKIIIGLDTSGSIGGKELEAFLSEVISIAKTKTEITIIECDSEIGKVYTPGTVSKIQHKVTGGGGTDFNPVFQYARENKIKSVVYFTDLCGPVDAQYGNINTLWVVRDTREIEAMPFGKVIAIN